MAEQRRGSLSERHRRVLRQMGKQGRLVFKESKRANVPPARKAKPQTAKPQTAKVADDAAPKKVVSKAPKQTEAQLARRRARFRELQKKYARQSYWDNVTTTGVDVGKELAGHAASWVATSLLMGPVAGTAAKLTKLYSQTKGGAATIRALGGRKFVERVAKEAEEKAKAKIKKAATKTVKFKPDGKRPSKPYKRTAKPETKIELETTPPSRSAPAVAKPKAQAAKPVAKPKPKKASALPDEKTLAAVNKVEREAAKAAATKPGRRPYKKPTSTEASGARAKQVLETAGLSVPKLAKDRIEKARKFLLDAKGKTKGKGAQQAAKGKGKGKGGKKAAAKPKDTPVDPKIAEMARDAKKAKETPSADVINGLLNKYGFIRRVGEGKNPFTMKEAKAKLASRFGRPARDARRAKSGKPAREQRRNKKQKDTETKAETQKAKASKAAKAAPAAEEGFNLAKAIGYKTEAVQKKMNAFFKGRGVSTKADLIEQRDELVDALNAVRGGGQKVAHGGSLGKKIDNISDVRGGKGAGSPIPKARDASAARAAQGRARDRSVAEVEERVAERAARAVRDKAGPVLRGITSNPIKGTKALFTKLAQGKISPAQMKKQLDPILEKATKAQKADFNRALDFFTRMQINMRAAKKAGKVRPEDTKALKNAEKQLRQMLATIALAAGMGAAAE